MLRGVWRPGWVACGAVFAGVGSFAVASIDRASADTVNSALIQAYQNNPQLNAQRAAARAVDEGVSIALGGYRPRVTATSSISEFYSDTLTRIPATAVTGQRYSRNVGENAVATYGINGTQTLFNGFQTGNRTRQAESQVFASRETLRTTEQTVLLSAVTAYMNLLRDTAILELQRSNVNVLEATLRQTRDRFNVGEVTRTDVAQSESRLAQGRSQLLAAESNYTTSKAQYRQVIGVEPGKLAAGTPVDRFSPRTLAGAVSRGLTENPQVTTAAYNVDAAQLQVKIAEGALYPTLTAQANLQKQYGSTSNFNTLQSLSASIVGQLSVPLYQGGSEYATIRQAKETLGQRRLDLDTARDQVRSNVVQAWGQLEAAKAQIEATTAQVAAAEIALNGVREEARVGQRTTLDVLNAQQDLVNARVALVTAQRDRVVASFSVLSATGGLSPQVLGLRIENYDPVVHYHQIRDSWFGVRTPDGR
jgi:outer membrane protein